jgi:hypothetical protein
MLQMKPRSVNHIPEVMAPGDSSSPPPSDVTPAAARLQQAFSELMELKLALATSQQQLKSACRKIEALTEINACLREELTRLSHHIVDDACHVAMCLAEVRVNSASFQQFTRH